ncbi:MAG TPA: TolC family protein [Castellaniella sp.]|uniref:TolC family protein n=1 Tax=Castellaniella sp. TaxID=1955812 RepID=UPI002EE6E629
MRRALLSAGACALLLAGCATYQPLPLPQQAKLAVRITEVRHVLPSKEAGTSVAIDVSRPLLPSQVGLLAVLNAPELRSERGELDLAQATALQSALLPNPSVSLGYAAVLSGPATAAAYTASLAQDIASLVTYRSRKAAAQDHVAQVDADLLWKEWQVAQKARLLSVGLYWNGLALSANESRRTQVTQATARMQAAVARGDASLSDLTPLLSAHSSLEQAVSALELQQARDWAELDGLLGLTPEARFAIARPRVPTPPGPLQAMVVSAPHRRPDLLALQLGYQSADESVRAAILGQFPAFALGGAWGSDTSQVRSAGPTVTFDLPIFNHGQGAVAQARATRLLLHERYQARLDALASTVLALQSRSRYLRTHLTAALKDASSAQTREEAARAAFEAGNLDERAFADYASTALAARLAVIDFNRGLDEARIGLQLELGLGLPQVRIAPLDSLEKS